MGKFHWQNCPPEFRQQVLGLQTEFLNILGSELSGFYLHGSLVSGCFNPTKSDLDLLALTHSPLKPDQKVQLANCLLENSRQPAPLEISFLNEKDLFPWRHPCPYDFHYSEGWRERFSNAQPDPQAELWLDKEHLDEDLAGHITFLHAKGICLYGRPISEAFPAVPWTDYLGSILADYEWGKDRSETYPVNLILNTCRTAAALLENRVLSKSEGGLWGLQKLPADLRFLIRKALDVYDNNHPDIIFGREELENFVGIMDPILQNKEVK